MSVPDRDIVCRFIKPHRDTWNPNLNQPTQRAFKQRGLSVWHRDRLRARGVSLQDLLIQNLDRYGQAHHTAGDYRKFALQVTQNENVRFQVQVEWRPDDVTPPWRQWSYAHVHVEATEGEKDFPREFRRLLAANARCVVPPG